MPNQKFEIFYLILIITILILLLSGFILTIIFLYQKRHLLYLKKLQDLKDLHEKDLIRTELEIQEQTLQNVSRELHDNIGLALTLAKLKLITIESNSVDAQSQINSSLTLISQAITLVSDLSKSLDSDFLRKNGFHVALGLELKNISSLGSINVEYNLEGNPIFISKEKEILLFRMVQECLNNVLKHAKAKTLKLNISYQSQKMLLSVIDDGIGFNVGCINHRTCGLNNIRHRTRILNGILDINSSSNTGTSINLEIPL